jgi:methyl-accepting chemotaxis protein
MMKRKLSIFQKLVIANILYSIPVIGLIYLMVGAQNVNIDFAKQEAKGNVLQRPLEGLLKSLLAHRFDPRDPGSRSEVKTALAALRPAMKAVGEDLLFTDEGLKKRNRSQIKLEAFESRWTAFASEWSRLSEKDRTEKLTALVGDVRTMITHAGDTSNLILDPDLDSYYLMDVTLLALPQSQDRIAEIYDFLRSRKSQPGGLTQADRIQVSVYAALVKQSDLDRITGDLQTAINEDPNFYGESPGLKAKLAPAIADYQAKTEALIALLNRIATGEKMPSWEEFEKGANAASDASFGSWDVAVAELDILLDKRLAELTTQKYKNLAFSLIALMGAVAILFWVSSVFNRNMTVVLHELRAAVTKTRTSGTDFVAMSEELSAVAVDQSDALQQTSSAIEEIKSMVEATMGNLATTRVSANDSLAKAQDGQNSVTKMLSAIGEISEANKMVLAQITQGRVEMAEITKIISEIGGKTKVINDIVFQTKLLSFNASVEAARAGEAGKGFAVVAEEVGNLAEMSGSASKEISTMLESSISRVTAITDGTNSKVEGLIETNKQKVEAGAELANECTGSIGAVLTRFQDVLRNADSIQQAAEEQAKGIADISTSIQRLDRVSSKNTGMSQKAAEQARGISDQAEQLARIVDLVQTEVLGQSGLPEQDDAQPEVAAPARGARRGSRAA